MTSWKDTLQLRDLDPAQRLELTCKACGHVHYLTASTAITSPKHGRLTLSEIERLSVCKARGCKGRVRMALVRKGDASGFVGGLA